MITAMLQEYLHLDEAEKAYPISSLHHHHIVQTMLKYSAHNPYKHMYSPRPFENKFLRELQWSHLSGVQIYLFIFHFYKSTNSELFHWFKNI